MFIVGRRITVSKNKNRPFFPSPLSDTMPTSLINSTEEEAKDVKGKLVYLLVAGVLTGLLVASESAALNFELRPSMGYVWTGEAWADDDIGYGLDADLYILDFLYVGGSVVFSQHDGELFQIPVDIDLDVLSYYVEAGLKIPIKRVELFGELGVGATRLEGDFEKVTGFAGHFDDVTIFGFKIGAGLDIRINDHFAIGITGTYHYIGDELESRLKNANTHELLDTVKKEVDVVSLLVGPTIRF